MESKRLRPARFEQTRESEDPQFEIAEGPRALFAGDALTRTLMPVALAGGGPFRTAASWESPWLVEALRDDYPILQEKRD
jgi:hypothetical protein